MQIKNALATVAITSLLVLGVVLLVPDTVEATQITQTTTNTPNTLGAFDVTLTITVPSGDHIPLDYAEVRLKQAPLSLGGNLITSADCTAKSTNTSPAATAVITSVKDSGGNTVTATNANLYGYGYDITGSGSGYTHAGTATLLFDGTASGYGYGGPTTLTVTIHVEGCTIVRGVSVWIQALVGTTGTQFWGLPTETTFANLGGGGGGAPPGGDSLTDTDGDGIPDRYEELAGTDPEDPDDHPDFVLENSAVTIIRNGNDVTVTWNQPGGQIKGVQIWRANSPFQLIATLPADATSYEDLNAPEGSEYRVTYYVDETAAGGYSSGDPSVIPGWEETVTVTATATETVSETTTTTGGTPTDDEGGRQTPGFGLVAVLAATVATLALIRRRL